MYKQLTSEQRYSIYSLLQNKVSKKNIARTINVRVPTIYRELRRNSGVRGKCWLEDRAGECEAEEMLVYFADPYSSWQKGAIENQNGLIRQYIPKAAVFQNVSHQFVTAVMDKINRRPRERLNFSTPQELFYQNIL